MSAVSRKIASTAAEAAAEGLAKTMRQRRANSGDRRT